MARSPIDENSVHGIVLEGDPSGTALPWKGNDATGGAYVELISPTGDSLIDDVNDAVKVSVVAGDIEIGAVEIKNSTDDTRATVGANGLHVDVQTSALPTGASTSAKQLPDGHNVQINALPTIYAGTKTVPTGTAEAIATTQTVHSVTIKALSTNTVAVYVGGSGITTSGFELLAGESVSLDVSNLATVFVISGSASQVVRYIAI